MSLAISIRNLGKMYKFYRSPAEKLLDLLGVNRVLFWRKPSTQTFWALRELNLDVKRGERLGIIGHNGAGKSTLLKIIGGIIAPTEGTAVVNGNVQALMELGTGFHPEFTGRQNIHAALGYQGLGVAAIRKAEREIVDFAELGEFIERPIKTYSAGMNARLAFATSTYLQPEILIIDEILGAGDAYFAGKCIERMRRITESSGATVLFVSHDISSVQRLCSRVVWIERGRIKMDGEPLGVIKAYSDHVRKDQDLRLKARDMKLARSQLTTANEGLYQTFLFHFVSDKPHPTKFHQIRGLRLLADGVEVGAIDVGGPMDNVPAQLHHVIDGPAMDWSQPIKAGGKWMRCYKDCGGFYQHAPFQFNVPRTEISTARRFTIEVDGWFDAGEPVILERHVDSGYERMATMASDCDGVQTFKFGNGEVHEGDPVPPIVAPEPISTPDDYGNRKVMLRGVQLLDGDGNERRVLTTGERVMVRLSYEAFETVRDPAFIFAVYFPDGQCASQVWATSTELGKPEISGRGSVQFVIDRLTLGRSAYVASAAIFTELRHDNVEPKAYHCLDRCIHFQVGQPLGEQYPERGLAPQQYYTEMVA